MDIPPMTNTGSLILLPGPNASGYRRWLEAVDSRTATTMNRTISLTPERRDQISQLTGQLHVSGQRIIDDAIADYYRKVQRRLARG